ncbi:MAG: phosphoribosyltransferase family protein [Sutterella sp.]|nr:adenine phosphoribosyltransferase [Sutterella sp.]MDD7427981.1 phosphoribosyltransferase family protein [Sutterella sp.]MDY3273716.1 phosphoribosyltransferase family protein [Duodenibacillus sp.]
MFYPIEVAGLKRDLRLFPVSDKLAIAAFILLGDTELTVSCASALLKLAPQFDYMLTAEAKSIPLIHEMAKQCGAKHYFVARKHMKLYMGKALQTVVHSITTAGEQKLFLPEEDVAKIRGKRILIVDDVISTGESLHALETLVNEACGTVCGRLAVLAEGDAQKRPDIRFLAPLPLFSVDGKPLPL